ncbi:MAG: PCP degradation transcriptional activation protein [Pseudomonadales bacterium]|nr:PCP degradation transcriptional activation protein [Pseudomonadales bacterium]
MHMDKIDIRRGDLHLLVVFDAIYREGTVTRASDRLHVTQSTLSHSLRRLRELFGDPLFERHGNVMTPTPKARSLIRPIQAGLEMLESSVNQIVPSQPRRVRQKLTIGMDSTDVAGFLPELVARQDADSDYDITIARYELNKFETRLVTGKFDVVIQPLAPHSEHVRHALMTREGLAVAARRGHPAVVGGAIGFDDYMRQRHVLITPGNASWDLVDMAFRQSRLNREIQVRCQDYWTACEIVQLTDCLLTGTRTTIGKIAGSFPELQVCAPPAELNMEPQDVYLYWHAARENDPANRWLRNNLLAILREASQEAVSK